jgi:hypothetical protein
MARPHRFADKYGSIVAAPKSVFGAQSLQTVTPVNGDGIPLVLLACVNYLELNGTAHRNSFAP